MAKLIEFCTPKNFTKLWKWAGRVRRGDIGEFSQANKTSSSTKPGPRLGSK